MTSPDQPPPSTWALGDYPAMAHRLVDAATAAVDAADIRSGHDVLDVGTGTGNAAVLAAQAGARVTAADPTPQLLDIAAQRAEQAHLTIEWQHGAAEQVNAPTDGFDRVLSVFGAMYAPDPARAAHELLRCCRSGGRIVLTAWTPDSFMAATNRAAAPYLPPPPPDGVPPTRWGDAGYVRSLFDAERRTVATTAATIQFEFANVEEAAGFWIRTAGHVQAERERLQTSGEWGRLHADLERCFAEANTDRTGSVTIASDYLITSIQL